MSSWPPAQVWLTVSGCSGSSAPPRGCLNRLFRRHCVLSRLTAIRPLPSPKGWEAGGQGSICRPSRGTQAALETERLYPHRLRPGFPSLFNLS